MAFKLVRERDNKTFIGDVFKSIDHDEDGNHVTAWPPKVGETTIVYNSRFDYWQTTLVTEILELTDEKCIFLTENSKYELIKDWRIDVLKPN